MGNSATQLDKSKNGENTNSKVQTDKKGGGIEKEKREKLLVCGLDPVAVYESLTKSLRKSWESELEQLTSKNVVVLAEDQVKRCAASRVQRMADFNEKKKKLENEVKTAQKKLNVKTLELKSKPDDENLKKEIENLEVQLIKAQKEFQSIEKEEKKMPWNVDTISKEGWSSTKINKPALRQDKSHLSEDEREKLYLDFIKENEKKIKHFAMLSKAEDCRTYLLDEPQLVCEETANYLTLWCLNLEIEEKSELMIHVSKQVISMQYILELAKQLDCNPRSCISSFFKRIQTAEKEYLDAYEDELKAFRKRIKDRAKEKIDKAMKEIEEEEREKRLGPGGLDPADVFESLPKSMQECFESRDIEKLKKVIAEMPEDEAKHHMKRCVDSGLWVPDARDIANEDDKEDKDDDDDTSNKEAIYAQIKESLPSDK